MKKYLPTLSIFCQTIICGVATLFLSQHSYSQGCVAVRHMSSCTVSGSDQATGLTANEWQFSIGYRYLYSHRHFVGRDEQKHRRANGTEVINKTHAADVSISYGLTPRLSVGLTVPLIYNDRSSLYEHLGNTSGQRFHTYSSGIGDVRVTGTYWLFNPETSKNGNVSIGIGVKAPTGNANVQDDFHKWKDEKTREEVMNVRRPVDQSIQLGDGGWGVNLELQGYRNVFKNGVFYFNGFYLLNPRNTNRTQTFRKDSVEVGAIRSVLSVADQFMARAGLSYTIMDKGLSASLGGRVEGIPAKDILGKEDGFRRPGYIVSVEPGLLYMWGKHTFAATVPIALVRDRIRSVYDIRTGGHGDAAFADYFVTLSYAHRF